MPNFNQNSDKYIYYKKLNSIYDESAPLKAHPYK